jgi:SAM-dependent methyltransferase
MLSFPLSEDEKNYLRSFSGIFRSPAEAEQYLYDSWERIQVVLRWLHRLQREGVRTVLELGANPYFLTLLIQRHLDFDLHLANFFGNSVENGRHRHTVEREGKKHEFHYAHFNIEVDHYPYEDNSFDCVVFCEILEHLLLNPDFAVSEIKRVLRPAGFVILSTPNSARFANLVKLIKGKNIYDGYSAYGIYGRHNREYTMPEVKDLLHRHEFEIVESQVRNIYPHPWRSRWIQALRPRTWYEHIFVLARSVKF